MYQAIDDFYKDNKDINVTLFSAVDFILAQPSTSAEKQKNMAKEKLEKDKKSTYSDKEESIWQYCRDRWTYYDKLEGGYSGDKHTNDVFNDASKKFGISATEAKSIWNKVDQANLGIK